MEFIFLTPRVPWAIIYTCGLALMRHHHYVTELVSEVSHLLSIKIEIVISIIRMSFWSFLISRQISPFLHMSLSMFHHGSVSLDHLGLLRNPLASKL
jgi:hypothetical protein